jgi:hypothetical protein
MEQHPIPQNVSSYQFKLVGDMTLKQFFQLAGGILVAIIIYSLPLLGIIKWPLAIISVLLGVGLAFLPFEERPLERWIFAFFRAIYSPTIFSWKKTNAPVKFFQDEGQDVSPQQDAALKNYLAADQPSGASAKLEKQEQGFLSKLTGLFSINVMPKTVLTPAVAIPEKPKEMKFPENTPTKIEPNATHLVVEEKPVVAPLQQNQVTLNTVAPLIAGDEMISTKQAIFSVDAAPPNPPTQPNVVVGQIVDQDRKIVEGAIMEIRDSMGRPVRALRSNKVGHFIIVTQLDNGHYEIITEKDGYEFTPVSFDASGVLIPPILVQGKRLFPAVEETQTIVKPVYSIN